MVARRQGLASRRRALGYSQEALAERLQVDRATIGRWERGDAVPRPHIRPKLAGVLESTLAELDALISLPPADDGSPMQGQSVVVGEIVEQAAPDDYLDAGESDEMIRREFLRLLGTTGALVSVQRSDLPAIPDASIGPVALDDLVDFESMNVHLWQAFSLSKSKRTVYPLVRQQLELLSDGLNRASGESTRMRLCALSGDLFQLAGEVFFDGNRYSEAAHCYGLAASASKEAGACDLWASALTRHAFVGMYEDRFDEASAMLAAASRISKNGDRSLSTRYWISAVQAELFAKIGEAESCNRALDAADRVHSLDNTMHNGGWLRFDGSRLAEERGACYVELGRPDLAEKALSGVLSQKLSSRRRGSVLIDLALLGVQCGDADQLLKFGGEALCLAQRTGSGYIARKLRGLRTRTQPFASDRRVSGFREQLAELDRA